MCTKLFQYFYANQHIHIYITSINTITPWYLYNRAYRIEITWKGLRFWKVTLSHKHSKKKRNIPRSCCVLMKIKVSDFYGRDNDFGKDIKTFLLPNVYMYCIRVWYNGAGCYLKSDFFISFGQPKCT